MKERDSLFIADGNAKGTTTLADSLPVSYKIKHALPTQSIQNGLLSEYGKESDSKKLTMRNFTQMYTNGYNMHLHSLSFANGTICNCLPPSSYNEMLMYSCLRTCKIPTSPFSCILANTTNSFHTLLLCLSSSEMESNSKFISCFPLPFPWASLQKTTNFLIYLSILSPSLFASFLHYYFF